MKSLLPFLLLPLLSLTALCLGDVPTPLSEVWHVLTGQASPDNLASFIILQVRLPQMLTALLCGCSLAAAGLVMQTVFSNPLADPSLLGVNAGAGLGAAIAMLLLGGSLTAGAVSLGGYLLTVAASCLGAFAIVLLLMSLSALFRSNLHLLVAGVMISFAASALISIFSFFATSEGLQTYVAWGMGDFGSVTLERLPLFAALLLGLLALLFLQTKALNALLLGADYARNLGIRPKRALRPDCLHRPRRPAGGPPRPSNGQPPHAPPHEPALGSRHGALGAPPRPRGARRPHPASECHHATDGRAGGDDAADEKGRKLLTALQTSIKSQPNTFS